MAKLWLYTENTLTQSNTSLNWNLDSVYFCGLGDNIPENKYSQSEKLQQASQ
jgi:hypothetical protein